MNNIERALFALESVAHLQGREAELLPLIEAARKDHDKVKDIIVLSALDESVATGSRVFVALRDAYTVLL